MSEAVQFDLVAKTIEGLEGVLKKELEAIGATDTKVVRRAVEFKGTTETVYKANYLCRTALRIIKPIAKFPVESENDLYKKVREIDWWKIIGVDSLLAIDTTLYASKLTHSKYVSQKIKDAIVDQFREKFNRRPSVDIKNPDFRIDARLSKNQMTISIDSSGDALFKRGYRVEAVEAPINEVLAAGLIILSGWDKQSTFFDPMCGSGTFLIEAAMLANNIPAGYYRQKFGFENWMDFERMTWKKIKREADENWTESEARIIGSDISENSLRVAKANLKFTKLHKDVELTKSSFFDIEAPDNTGMLITNPPYGERLKQENIKNFYSMIGDQLKTKYAGWKACLISSDQDAMKFIGLKPSKRIPVFNGQLECKFNRYELYEGSKKEKKNS